SHDSAHRLLFQSIGPSLDAAPLVECDLNGDAVEESLGFGPLTLLLVGRRDALIFIEVGKESRVRPECEDAADYAVSLARPENRARPAAKIIKGARRAPPANMPRTGVKAASHRMTAFRAQRAINEKMAKHSLHYSGSSIRPSSSRPQCGLKATSQRCPSGSAKWPL